MRRNGLVKAMGSDEYAYVAVCCALCCGVVWTSGWPGKVVDRIGRLYRSGCCVGLKGYDERWSQMQEGRKSRTGALAMLMSRRIELVGLRQSTVELAEEGKAGVGMEATNEAR